jgi:ketosteroid isomerase-like protein
MSISPTPHDVQAQRQRSAEEWVHGFSAGWREPGGPHEFVDHFTPLLDPEIRLIQPQMPTLVGLEAFRRVFAEPLFDLIPDIHGEVRGWAADGDTIWTELELRGTFGGRPLTLETVDRITLRDGRAIERRAFCDPTPLLVAAATRPRAWARFARVQALQARELIRARRNR